MMANTEMTNNRAIVVLKCADLAVLAAFAAGFLFLITRSPEDALKLPFLSLFVVALLAAAAYWQLHRALKKRVGDNSYSAWNKKTGWWFIAVFIPGLAALKWDMFVATLPTMAAALFAGIVFFRLVPALLKRRMEADAFAKFDRKYQKAAVAVLMLAFGAYIFLRY